MCFISRQWECLCFSCYCNWVCMRMYNGNFFNWFKQLSKKKDIWQWYWLLWVALLKTVSRNQSKLLAVVSDERTQNYHHIAGLGDSSTNNLRLVFRVSVLRTLFQELSSRNLNHLYNSKLWKRVYVCIPAQPASHRGEPHMTTSLLLYHMADMLQSDKWTDKLIIKQCS